MGTGPQAERKRTDAPGPGQGFLARWRAELPGVAASLTTALILFVASLSFAPVRGFLFGKPAVDYPILCTADPVPGPNGGRRVEFYVINRSDQDFTGSELQQRLNQALEGSGFSGSSEIFLDADPELQIGPVAADDGFNGDKGRLGLVKAPDGVKVTIGEIKGRSILRGLIDLPGLSAENVTRGARGAYVPFRLGDLLTACYTLH